MNYSIRFSCFVALMATVVLFSSCDKDDPILEHKITFQDYDLQQSNYWNGEDQTGNVTFELATFYNEFTPDDWGGFWQGFALSNITDTETPGFENQYSAYVKDGGDADNIYAVCYVSGSPYVNFSQEVQPQSLLVTNSTYAYLSLLHGDDFTKQFGDDDWFKLTITGLNAYDDPVSSLNFYLADFRDGSSTIVDDWTKVDLTPLGDVSKLIFSLESTDVGEWGMNTPAYFCLDELVYQFE